MTGERLLVIAPHGRDAQVIVDRLGVAGVVAQVAGADEIVAAIEASTLAAAIIADEAMTRFDLVALAAALAAQPSWSDCAFLLLTRRDFGLWTRAQITALLGNVTMLERPLRADALVSAARSALRARARQHKAQAYIAAREVAEAQVRALAADLENRVLVRTRALSRALADRQAIEAQLRESEANYRFTVELSRQIPWIADREGRLVNAGDNWHDVTGLARDGALGAGWQASGHPDDLVFVDVAWRESVAALTPFECEFRLRKACGSYAWFRSRAAPRLDAAGAVVRWYGTLEDIDARRHSEVRLAQTQSDLANMSRLSAMGTMASTLAHELNQPLTAVVNYVRGSRRLLEGSDEQAPVRAALIEADRNAVRAGEIVRRVRAFVARGEVQRLPESLNALVREACAVARIEARSTGVFIRLDLHPGLPEVMVDRIQVQQVLTNLLRNATEALAGPPAPRIVVSTAPVSASRASATGPAANRYEVTVRDNGAGVPGSTQARLFDTFNTSKPNGMGVGLSICRTIIEAHGGHIWHRPARGGGAVFGFTLVAVPE